MKNLGFKPQPFQCKDKSNGAGKLSINLGCVCRSRTVEPQSLTEHIETVAEPWRGIIKKMYLHVNLSTKIKCILESQLSQLCLSIEFLALTNQNIFSSKRQLW